jgi:hypothetical protein
MSRLTPPRTRASGPVDDLLIADKGQGSIVLRLRTGVYFELDRSATEIVRLVQRCGPAEAVEVLAARHGRPAAEIEADVDRVLHTLEHTTLPATARPRHPTWRGGAAVVLRWFRLPLSGKVATVYTSGLVVAVEALLYIGHIDRVSRCLGAPLLDSSEAEDLPPLDPMWLTSRERTLLAALASVQRRWLFDATCLRRALAAAWILRRRHPRLCLGLTGAEGALAHAWLVVGGHTIDALTGAPVFQRVVGPVVAGGASQAWQSSMSARRVP